MTMDYSALASTRRTTTHVVRPSAIGILPECDEEEEEEEDEHEHEQQHEHEQHEHGHGHEQQQEQEEEQQQEQEGKVRRESSEDEVMMSLEDYESHCAQERRTHHPHPQTPVFAVDIIDIVLALYCPWRYNSFRRKRHIMMLTLFVAALFQS
eukprot:COSAG04_NODE_454_length_14092_cov_330.378261_14_plen_152_part_00